MKPTLFLSLALAGSAFCAGAAELAVTPGSLSALLTDEVRADSSLTLTGSMDARDFEAISTLAPTLKSLDLSGVSIAAYRPARPMMASVAEYDADELPAGALFGMHLTELTLPASLRSIGMSALAANDFASLQLPATVTYIGEDALHSCPNLTALTLPASVAEVGPYALAGCTALASVDMQASAMTKLPRYLFTGDTALATLTLPANLKEIGQGALAGTTALQELTLPSSLTTIGESAMSGSGLTAVTVPPAVRAMGDFAFSGCPNLAGAEVLSLRTPLSRGMFSFCPSFVTLTAPEQMAFPSYLFAGTPVADPGSLLSVSEIGDYALRGSQAKTLVLGSTLVYLGDGALEGMTALDSIDAIALDTAVPALGRDVFAGVDQPNVMLKVNTDSSDAWKDADQWNKFLVSAVTSVSDLHLDGTPAVSARFDGTVLRISADTAIESVQVYTADGKAVLSLSPRSLTAEAETSGLTDRVYVVRVVTEGPVVSTFKLMC